MKAISTIGLDLAKNVFQAHGVDEVVSQTFHQCESGMEVVQSGSA